MIQLLKKTGRYIPMALLFLVFMPYYSGAAIEAETKADSEAQVTFVELGSKNCIPCKMMQPVMDAIEEKYAGKVRVVFHDVWTEEGKPYGQKYNVRAIPTQVFLDKNGNEFFRHTGFLSEKSIVDLLTEHGITKE
jgi:thioredoxin 1